MSDSNCVELAFSFFLCFGLFLRGGRGSEAKGGCDGLGGLIALSLGRLLIGLLGLVRARLEFEGGLCRHLLFEFCWRLFMFLRACLSVSLPTLRLPRPEEKTWGMGRVEGE